MRPTHTRLSVPIIVLLLWGLSACSTPEVTPDDDDDSSDHKDHLEDGDGLINFGDNPSNLQALNAVFTATTMDVEVHDAAYRIEAGVGLTCEKLRAHHALTRGAQALFDQEWPNGDILERLETILQSRVETWDLPNWLVRVEFRQYDPRESPLPPEVSGFWYHHDETAQSFAEALEVLDTFDTYGTAPDYELDWQAKDGWVVGWVESTARWRDRMQDFVIDETFTLRADFEAPICELDQETR